jgi:hypothetical protein
LVFKNGGKKWTKNTNAKGDSRDVENITIAETEKTVTKPRALTALACRPGYQATEGNELTETLFEL